MIKVLLNELLEKKGVTKYYLSKKTGISANALSKFSNNKTTQVSFTMLNNICNILDCNIEDILKYKKDEVEK
ncbi:helix-turn-helix transcriptional regulator [Clostridium felsineum]|uniref:helix-turn-helix domain-containing protein n=1 Tax=Clostridium felsineum TaxID=36839 RepID=UPI00214D485A|nr:helix-turn-helix transcriptional regulator [Clostridium felsineum]MCR3761905.1 helix-turn-helix transcriptional regulator [Clostridium felsineum]